MIRSHRRRDRLYRQKSRLQEIFRQVLDVPDVTVSLPSIHPLILIDLRPCAAAGNPSASRTAHGLAHLLLQLVHHVREDVQPLIGQLLGTLPLESLAATAFLGGIRAEIRVIPREIPPDFPPRLPAGDLNRTARIRVAGDEPFPAGIVVSVVPAVADVRRQSAAGTLADWRPARALVFEIVAVHADHRLLARDRLFDLAVFRRAECVIPRLIWMAVVNASPWWSASVGRTDDKERR